MIQDPYKVLGVAQGATQDEIKKAYRRKAKENHPDLHPDDPHATERMNEINEAYDMLMNPSKYQQRREQEQAREQARQQYQGYYGGQSYGQQSYGGQQGYSQQGYGGGQSYGSWGGFDFEDMFGFGARQQTSQRRQHQPGDPDAFRRAIDAINMGQYQQASIHLNGVVSTQRTARWYYLCALTYDGLGQAVQALDCIRTAVRMDPNSMEYRRVLQRLQQEGQEYQQQGQAWGMNTDVSRWCMTLCAANLLCSMCGGRAFFCC